MSASGLPMTVLPWLSQKNLVSVKEDYQTIMKGMLCITLLRLLACALRINLVD